MGWTFNATGMGLMIFALAFLIIGGVSYNNLLASGFTNPQPATTCISINCPAYGQTNGAPIIICQTPTQCQLSAPSLLNPNSPFTFLFSGDLPGFVASFSQAAAGSSSLNAMSACSVMPGGGANNTITRLHCTSASWATVGAPYGKHPIVGCAFLNPANGVSSGFNVSANTAPVTTKSGTVNETEWIVSGCLPKSDNSSPFNESATLQFYACLTANVGAGCVSGSNDNGSIIVDKYLPGILDLIGSASTQGLNFFAFIGFIIGIVLIVMSFGIGGQFNTSVAGTAVGGGLSTNPQGTKLAQVLGIGLTVYIPFASEFSGWFAAIAGFGLDVLANVLVPALFFVGLWTQISQGASSTG